MFCKNCGKENTDDSKFCESCGQELKTNTKNDNYDNRQELLSEIKKAKDYVFKAERHFNDEGNIKKDIIAIQSFVTANSNVKKNIKIPKNIISNLENVGFDYQAAKRKWNIAILIKNIIPIILYLIVYIISAKEENYLFILLTFFPFLFACFFNTKKIISKHSIFTQIKNQLPALKEQYNKWYSDAYNKYSSEINDYVKYNDVIPAKYLSIYALNYIEDTLINKRADSLKEALNLFEDYEAKQEIIRQNDEIYRSLQDELDSIMLEQQYQKDRNGVTNALLVTDLLLNIR